MAQILCQSPLSSCAPRGRIPYDTRETPFAKGARPMKLLHLSDLHLGKRVNAFSMLEDQRYILEEILSLAVDRRVDGVLLAGTSMTNPSPRRRRSPLLDQFLTRLARAGIPVFAISGNHDSPER